MEKKLVFIGVMLIFLFSLESYALDDAVREIGGKQILVEQLDHPQNSKVLKIIENYKE